MPRIAVINVVGLTESLLKETLTPNICALVRKGRLVRIKPPFPAVTCTAQANYLTGKTPSVHGIVGNGWYNRDLAEVQFWKQSNHLVKAPKLWEDIRQHKPDFTCAKLFWWNNMYSSADWSITPRPMYPADGRKVFDIYTWPYSIRPEIKADLGEFPFPCFWGPAAGVNSPQGKPDGASKWIAEAAKWMELKNQPSLQLVYLPHLDYNLQRLGPLHPDIATDLHRIDSIVGDLVGFFTRQSVHPVLISEYGITPVDTPVHINRLFRQRGWLSIKEELGVEILDAGASRVFAVADHQVAHIYLNDESLDKPVRELLEHTQGVAHVYGKECKQDHGVDHSRAGDLVVVAEENAWFTYYYWLDDLLAPDFARTVDIHRKPGYDPVELFLDPAIPAIKLRVLWRILQKRLGFRMLMDVIPLDASLVKGSHGCCPKSPMNFPLLILPANVPGIKDTIESTDVYGILRQQFL